MALYPTNYTLTQGSLHYRLPTLGYQKQNPYGVRQFANFLCAALPFEMAIKSRTPMGFVSLMNCLCARSSIWQEMKLKKRNTYGVALFYFHLFKREMRRRQSLFAGFRHALAHSPKLIQARKWVPVWDDSYKQEGHLAESPNALLYLIQ